MSDVFIHNKNSIKSIICYTFLGVIPLILYGIYKNGILVYQKELIDLWEVFKIIILILISFIIYYLVNIVIKRQKLFNIGLLSTFLIPIFMPPKVSLILYVIGYFIGTLIISFLPKKIKLNSNALLLIIIYILLILFNNYSFYNDLEKLNIYSFSFFDYLWGRNVAGICASNIILGLFILIFYSLFNVYKKEISVSAILTFIFFTLLLNNFDFYAILNANSILGFIFIASDMKSSPITYKNRVVYGVLIGITTALLSTFVSYYSGVFVAVFMWSLLFPLLQKVMKNAKILSIFQRKKKFL